MRVNILSSGNTAKLKNKLISDFFQTVNCTLINMLNKEDNFTFFLFRASLKEMVLFTCRIEIRKQFSVKKRNSLCHKILQ